MSVHDNSPSPSVEMVLCSAEQEPKKSTTAKVEVETVNPLTEDLFLAILSKQLSDATIIKLGEVDEDVDMEAHTLSLSLKGRKAMVFFGDDPSEYIVVDVLGNSCMLLPSPMYGRGHGPSVLIDPRNLSDALAQLPGIKCSDQPEHRNLSAVASGSGSGMQSKGKGKAKIQEQGEEDEDSEDPDANKKLFSSGIGKGARGKYTSYNAGISDAVNMQTKLPQMPIGAVEFLTFFPHHTQWPALMLRLFRNGWPTFVMAKAVLHARGRLTREEFTRRKAAMRHQLRTIVHNKYGAGASANQLKDQGHQDFLPFVNHTSGNNHDLYDVRLPVQTSGDVYQPPRSQPILAQPATLRQVIQGVVNFPAGEDEGVLTKAILWCQTNGYLGQDTDFLPTVIAAQNFTLPGGASTNDWDAAAVRRFAIVTDPTS